MEARLHRPHVPSELLVDPRIALRHNFVGVFHKAAADARRPGPHAATAFSPEVHAFAVAWNFGVVLIGFWQNNMLGLAV